jgi:ketosteroid isomerase-like protein
VSEANVALIRRLYEGLNRDDFAIELVAEDAEYVNPPYAIEPGTRRGRDAFLAVWDTYEDFEVEVDEIIDAGGDDVVVLGRFTASGRGSGVPLAGEMGFIWTVRDGLGVRFRWFQSHQEALQAAELSARG